MPESPASRRGDVIPAWTSLRFVAALAVVVYHLWRFEAWHVALPVQRLVAALPVAVSLFFVLSGAVLAHVYGRADGALATTKGAFWRARAARVWPVHVLALVVVFPVVRVLWRKAGGDDDAWSHELWRGAATLALLQAWIPGSELSWNPPAWSISVEAFAYLVFPWCAPPLLRARRSVVVTTMIACVLVGVLVPALVVAFDPDGAGRIDHATHTRIVDVVKYHPLVRLPEFLFGIATGRLMRDGVRPPRIALALVASVVVASVMFDLVPWLVLHNAWCAPLWALLLLALADVRAPSSSSTSSSSPSPSSSSAASTTWRAALACHPVLQRLGDASYALYALHVPVLYWYAGLGERLTGTKVLEQPAFAVVAVALCIGVSVVVHVAFEAPLRAALRPRAAAGTTT